MSRRRGPSAELLPGRLNEYDRLFTGNRIFEVRTRGMGMLPPEIAMDYACSGPTLRGSGVNYDLRRAAPYEVYDRLDFDVITHSGCDCLARYLVRMGELRQSVRISSSAWTNCRKASSARRCRAW